MFTNGKKLHQWETSALFQFGKWCNYTIHIVIRISIFFCTLSSPSCETLFAIFSSFSASLTLCTCECLWVWKVVATGSCSSQFTLLNFLLNVSQFITQRARKRTREELMKKGNADGIFVFCTKQLQYCAPKKNQFFVLFWIKFFHFFSICAFLCLCHVSTFLYFP